MASEQDVNNQRDLNAETEINLSLEEQIINLLANRRGIDSDILSDQQSINNVLEDQVKNMSFEAVQRKTIKSLSSDISKIAEESYSIQKDQLGLTETNESIAKKQEALSRKQLLLEQQREQLLQSINNGTATDAELNKDIADSIKAQVNQAQKVKGELDKIAGDSKEISDNLGVKGFAGIKDITKAIPGLKKFSGPFEAAAEAARKQAVSNKETFGITKKIDKESLEALKTGKGLTADKIKSLGLEGKLIGKNGKALTGTAAAAKSKALGITKVAGKGIGASMSPFMAGLKSMGPMLKKALGPLSILQELVNAFKLIDGASGEIAKELGVSADEARSIVRSSTESASSYGDIMVSTKDVIKAQRTLNKELGTSVNFSGEFAAEFASISERTKLSGGAMSLFASNAMIAGGTIKDQLNDVNAVTLELNSQNNTAISFKEIQEGIAKASKSALLSAGRNVKELANQVYQAKLLGVEQSKVESIADSLLDFEGSIAKELEAELLLGKDLNLEKARQAALDNDLATVASEIAKQVGTAADFQEMNRIEAEALASAVGMTREELASALVNQENLAAVQKAGYETVSDAQKAYNELKAQGLSADEAAERVGGKALANQLESVSSQEKLTAVTEKLQDLFVSLVEPLVPVFDILMQIVESAINPLMKALSPVLQIVGDLLGSLLKPIAQILSYIIGLIVKLLQPAFNVIQDTVDYIKIILEGWMGVFKGIGMILTGDFSKGFELIGESLISMFKGLLGYILDIVDFALESMLSGVNLVLEGMGMNPIEVNVKKMVMGEEEEEGGENTRRGAGFPGDNQPAPVIGLATGGIVTSPTTALIGEGGEPEAVVPLSKAPSMGFGGNEKTIELLERLVMAVEKGGIVELDGNKVGTALGLASYKT